MDRRTWSSELCFAQSKDGVPYVWVFRRASNAPIRVFSPALKEDPNRPMVCETGARLLMRAITEDRISIEVPPGCFIDKIDMKDRSIWVKSLLDSLEPVRLPICLKVKNKKSDPYEDSNYYEKYVVPASAAQFLANLAEASDLLSALVNGKDLPEFASETFSNIPIQEAAPRARAYLNEIYALLNRLEGG